MDLNGGSQNNNASNARVLTQLALDKPELDPRLPSLAEALAVFGSSTLVIGSVDTPFQHHWPKEFNATNNILEAPGRPRTFKASVVSKVYKSGHTRSWKRGFFLVLSVVPVISAASCLYFIRQGGTTTDVTEPQNLFALSINSPPSAQVAGCCGGGLERRHWMVPWRVRHLREANHYFFEYGEVRPWGEKPGGGRRRRHGGRLCADRGKQA